MARDFIFEEINCRITDVDGAMTRVLDRMEYDGERFLTVNIQNDRIYEAWDYARRNSVFKENHTMDVINHSKLTGDIVFTRNNSSGYRSGTGTYHRINLTATFAGNSVYFKNKKYDWIPLVYTNVSGNFEEKLPTDYLKAHPTNFDIIAYIPLSRVTSTVNFFSGKETDETLYRTGEAIYFSNQYNDGIERLDLTQAGYAPRLVSKLTINGKFQGSDFLPDSSDYVYINHLLTENCFKSDSKEAYQSFAIKNEEVKNDTERVYGIIPYQYAVGTIRGGYNNNSTFIVSTKEQIRQFYEDLGFIVTFNLNEAMYKKTSEWSEGPPKFPDNPAGPPPGGGNPGGGTGGTPIIPGGGTNNSGGGSNPSKPPPGTGGIIHERPSKDNPIIGGDGTLPNGGNSDTIPDGSFTGGASYLSSSYAMNYAEVKELQSAFVDGSLWTNFKTLFKDPESGIVNLLKFPFDVRKLASEESGELADPITMMGVNMSWVGGSVSGWKMDRNITTKLEMGSFEFKEGFKSFLDYDPYTKITLYIPYVGFRDIPANMVMGKTVRLVYNVSYMDGSMLALLYIDGIVMQTYDGIIGQQIPLNKSDFSNVIQSNIKSALATTAVAGAASFASSIPITKSVVASGSVQATAPPPTRDLMFHGMPMGDTRMAMDTGTTSAPASQPASQPSGNKLVSSAYVMAGANFIGAVTNKRAHGHSMGSTNAIHGTALSQVPYVIIERPNPYLPDGYASLRGLQFYEHVALKELSGFTVCDDVKLHGFNSATDSEIDEIKMLLQTGVII